MTTFLSDAEIAELCKPLLQPHAQVKYLRGLGLQVSIKPNGRPIVVRAHAERVLSGGLVAESANAVPAEPNKARLVELFKGKRGPTPSIQSA